MAQDTETLTVDAASVKMFDLLSADPEFAGEVEDREEVGGEVAEDLAESDESEAEEYPAEEDADDPEDDGTEYEDESEETEDEDDHQTYTVKVDGKEFKVTLDEALAGYQRTQDYTRKTQAVAEERRTLEAEKAQTVSEREQYRTRLAAVEAALADLTPQEPDWDALRERDPVKFAQQFADWQLRQGQMKAVQEEQARLQAVHQREMDQQRQQMLAQEAERLHAAIPKWTDDSVAKAEKAALVAYAQEQYGYSEQDLAQVLDHRPLVMLYKAMKFDALQKKGDSIKAKAKKTSTLKPGQPGARKAQNKSKNPARERLKQTGRVQDAAATIFDLLGQE